MKNKTRAIPLLLTVCMLVVSAAACTKAETPVTTDTSDEPIVLRLNTNMSERDLTNSSFGLCVSSIIEEVERESNGRLKIDLFLHSQLGKTPTEVIGGAQLGSFEMFNHVAASWGEYTNAFLPVNIPYLFTDEKVLQQFLRGKEGQKIKDKVLADTSARVIAFGYLGFRNIVNDKRPITSPDDIKGLKMRVLSDPYTIAAFKAFGATPVTVSYSELYTASQQGLIDGSDGPYINILNSKLNEVQKYLSNTRNAYTLAVLCISDKAYQSLPEDLRKIFDTACANAQDLAEKEDVFSSKALEELKKTMTYNDVTDEQMKQFVEKTAPVRKMAREELGEEAWNAIIEEIEAIEKRLGK